MAACGGSNCKKRCQCKLYIANRETNITEEFIDYSRHGSSSIIIDTNGNKCCDNHYICGDFSDGYPLFQQRELNPEYDWVPCSIRNPKKYGKYLVTCKDIPISQIRLFDGEWDSIKKVIAWRYLPKVYKE